MQINNMNEKILVLAEKLYLTDCYTVSDSVNFAKAFYDHPEVKELLPAENNLEAAYKLPLE